MAAFPSYTGADVMLLAAAFLNDQNRSLYTDTNMFPYCQSAIEKLQTELNNNSVQFVAKKSANITIPAGIKSYNPLDGTGSTPVVALADFIAPNEVWERASGSADLFARMEEQSWEPEIFQDVALRYWTWRSQLIYFVGATSDREIQIKYDSGTLYIAAKGSTVGIILGKEYLAHSTAEMCARYIGENTERADTEKAKAEEARDTLISAMVNNMQGTPMRRRPYRVNPFSFRR